MAVTLTAQQLLDAINAGADASDETTELAIITRLRAVAIEQINRRAPDAPSAIQDEAMIRYVAYLKDVPAPSRSRYSPFSNAWVNCGAASLCKPWVKRRAGTVSDPDATT